MGREATRVRSPGPAEESKVQRYDSDLGTPVLVWPSAEELKKTEERNAGKDSEGAEGLIYQ